MSGFEINAGTRKGGVNTWPSKTARPSSSQGHGVEAMTEENRRHINGCICHVCHVERQAKEADKVLEVMKELLEASWEAETYLGKRAAGESVADVDVYRLYRKLYAARQLVARARS